MTKLVQRSNNEKSTNNTGPLLVPGLFCTDFAVPFLYYQDLGSTFSQYSTYTRIIKPNHTNAFSFENICFSIHFLLSPTLKKQQMLMKSGAFDDGVKRSVLKTHHV